MKTVVLRDESYQAISTFLDESLAQEAEVMAILVRIYGQDSRQVKAEAARYSRMTAAWKEFRDGPSAWRGTGSSITSDRRKS